MMLGRALEYAVRGWPVFPTHWIRGGACSCGRGDCSSPGKHPLTRHGLKEASTDLKHVVRWWEERPSANIGIATGGVYVVDLDGEEGIAAWEALEIEHGPAPTLMARTGGGGIHRYYLMPPDATLPNTAGRLAPHVDTRGAGGYVLAPSSNHQSGGCYAWLNEIVIAPLPSWIMTSLRPKLPPQPRCDPHLGDRSTAYGERTLLNMLSRVRSAPEGQRNQTLVVEAFIAGQYIAGGELDRHGVLEALVSASADPDVKKSQDTARRALQEGSQYPRQKRDDNA